MSIANRNVWQEGNNNAPSSQSKNKKLVKESAQKIGLKLDGFRTDSILELFYNVSSEKGNLCYVSKGWNDGGFRVGEYLEIAKDTPNFKEKFYKIFKACSKNLISVDVRQRTPGVIGLSLEIGIYRQGFNEEVLREAIDSLEDSLQGIRITLES